eukprot:6464904-Amphidinium_carterae.1
MMTPVLHDEGSCGPIPILKGPLKSLSLLAGAPSMRASMRFSSFSRTLNLSTGQCSAAES